MHLTRLFACFSALTLLAACTLLSPGPQKIALRTLTVSASIDANQNHATALDIVLVYDPAAVALLPKTGPDWFQQRAALRAGLGDALEVVSLELPPALPPTQHALPASTRNAVAALAFAQYTTAAGQPVINLSGFRHVGLHLEKEQVTLSGDGKR